MWEGVHAQRHSAVCAERKERDRHAVAANACGSSGNGSDGLHAVRVDVVARVVCSACGRAANTVEALDSESHIRTAQQIDAVS